MKMTLHTDGGARGNPGPAGAGVVLTDENNKVVKELGSYLGVCTNNEAEYRALILGLDAAKELGVKELEVFMDSELIVKQVRGEYKVRKHNMQKFHAEVLSHLPAFTSVTFTHVKREKNTHADKLVNEVLDAIN